ncbi:MAG TPA: hypothetical protein DG942_01970 [Ruminococcaceae bacterium]|jgi:hypothetical protein|nr:hypothetical protein [Oscillospiraceae bacterium]
MISQIITMAANTSAITLSTLNPHFTDKARFARKRQRIATFLNLLTIFIPMGYNKRGAWGTFVPLAC